MASLLRLQLSPVGWRSWSGCCVRQLVSCQPERLARKKRDTREPLEGETRCLEPRPPVVAVMGHVDHGKTSLLDKLRQTSVAAREAGGITQHIGAFSVQLSSGERLTFLDTPGHAAFSAMRARGASLTDIAVLVVAADDGVQVQTRECVELVTAASVPLVVAISKCDKPAADPDRVEEELLQCGVQLERFGGDTQSVRISAKTGDGMLQLEEALLAEGELNAVMADPSGPVEAVVVEAHIDRGLGAVASVVVKHGTLECGQVLVAGQTWGKVRAMFDERKRPVKEAPPSSPVLTVGWRELPSVGEQCLQAESEAAARSVVHQRAVTPAREPRRAQGGERGEVGVIVKGDVMGSVEVIVQVLERRQPVGMVVRVVNSGVGPVVESDVELAASTGSVILAFGVSSTKAVRSLTMKKNVTIHTHTVIYKLLEMLKDHVQQSLPRKEEEEVVGEAEVLRVFNFSGARAVCVGGCRVKSGRLLRSVTFRLLRDGEVIHEGPLSAMKQGKNDISEARKEVECGLSFRSLSVQWKEGDRVVAFTRRRVPPSLEWDLGF